MTADLRTEIIKTEGLTKRFGGLVAVDRVDYSLREYEVAGIIGSNGAGKTTFFNLLTGYFVPDGGSILFKGNDITRMVRISRDQSGRELKSSEGAPGPTSASGPFEATSRLTSAVRPDP